MKGMSTIRDDMRFFTRKPEAKTERFEADRAFLLIFYIMVGDDGHGCGYHVGKRVI